MPVKFKISVVQVGTSLKVTIPKELAEHINISKGDQVIMWSDNSHIVMYKDDNFASLVPKTTNGDE